MAETWPRLKQFLTLENQSMIDLNTWNLSVPVGQPAMTISSPALAAGYQDRYFQNIRGKLFFFTPLAGSTTTANSKYPRTELRETQADGRVRNWTYPSGDHYLRTGVTVTQVPSSGRIVIGQIHAYQQLTPMMKLEYRMSPTTGIGSVVAIVRLTPAGKNLVYTIGNEIQLNQRFTYVVSLSNKGLMSIWVNKSKWSTPVGEEWATYPLYFKAGVYVQDNEDSGGEAGAAVFDNLRVEHLPAQ